MCLHMYNVYVHNYEVQYIVLTYLEFMPQVLYGISIWTFGGRPPPVDVIVLEELGSARCVLGIVILHKSVTTGIDLLTERNKAPV